MRPTCGAKVPSRALSREFGEEYISVVDADPEPDAWHALFAFKRANAITSRRLDFHWIGMRTG
jgi:hypothetical protein